MVRIAFAYFTKVNEVPLSSSPAASSSKLPYWMGNEENFGVGLILEFQFVKGGAL